MVLFIPIELFSKDFLPNKVYGSARLSYPTTWCSYLYRVAQMDRLFASSERILGPN